MVVDRVRRGPIKRQATLSGYLVAAYTAASRRVVMGPRPFAAIDIVLDLLKRNVLALHRRSQRSEAQ